MEEPRDWRASAFLQAPPQSRPHGFDEPGPTLWGGETMLLSGQVERTTAYEKGLPFQQKRDAEWVPDTWIWDDQNLVVTDLVGGPARTMVARLEYGRCEFSRRPATRWRVGRPPSDAPAYLSGGVAGPLPAWRPISWQLTLALGVPPF